MDRWLLWTAVFVGSVAALTTIRGLNHHPKSASLNMAIFWPSLFLAVFGFKFLLALCCWRVKIGDGRLELSEGRNVRYHHLAKVARVTFQPTVGSMLFEFKAGRRLEVFLGGQAQIDRLKHYLRSHGVSVDDLKS
jgi:hypothetical protein